MKKASILIMLLAVIAMAFVSCTKEEAADPRDSIVGTYSGTVTGIYEFTKTYPLAYAENDSSFSYNTVIKIDKDPDNLTSIKITEIDADGNLVFKGVSVKVAPNGVAFNITEQTLIDGYYALILNGYQNYVTETGEKFDGAYITATKKVTFGFNGVFGYKWNNQFLYSCPYKVLYAVTKQ